MKKFILIIAVSGSFVMCKKGEITQGRVEETLQSADSTINSTAEAVNSVSDRANSVLDSAQIKIKDLENTKNEVKNTIEATSKIADSLADKISSVKLESKSQKRDSTGNKNEKIIVNVAAPKVIKETKVVYRDKPTKDNREIININRMVKNGLLEINVTDAETAKEIVKEELLKYDGQLRSENISLNNNDKKIAYLKVKVPIQKFDYLMDDLSYNIGKIENKSIEVSGDDFKENTMCDIAITLYGTEEGYASTQKPATFGDQSLAAISSGWNVITSIFLFILPMWPLLLIAGAGYYFYKKNRNNSGTHTD